jgi:hypothetical protein
MNTLFLDLEDTIITPVIEGWHMCEIINLNKINKFIVDNNIEVISIFSFALHDKLQKNLFTKYTQPMIEKALGLPLFMIPNVEDDIIPACCRQNHIAPALVSFEELCDFWGKQLSFLLFIRETFKNNKSPMNIFFLDDAIIDMHFQLPHLQIEAKTFNIDNLFEPTIKIKP